MSKLTHLDLFSGIGGFALAAKWTGLIETIAFCEIEKYAQKLLNQNFPTIPVNEDIRKLDGQKYREPDILTAGFPCQPYSIGGKKLGSEDPRDLWPELCRVIKESRPRWIIGENSFNVLNLAFDKIKSDLEAIGYEVGEPLVIPACGVNADHRRKRAWICAHSNKVRLQGSGQESLQRFQVLQRESTGIFKSARSRRCISSPRNLRSYNGIPYGVDRIKGLGNSIVPQIAYNILMGICSIEQTHE